jgi:hypothetical protein
MDLDNSGYNSGTEYSPYNLQVCSRPLVSGRLQDLHAKRIASYTGGQHPQESLEALTKVQNLTGKSHEGESYKDPSQTDHGLPNQSQNRCCSRETHDDEGLDIIGNAETVLVPSPSGHHETWGTGSHCEDSFHPHSTEQGKVLINVSNLSDLQLITLLRTSL